MLIRTQIKYGKLCYVDEEYALSLMQWIIYRRKIPNYK